MAQPSGKPNRWRKRAAEIRAIAQQIPDHWTKNAVLRLAADYERQAREAENVIDRNREPLPKRASPPQRQKSLNRSGASSV